MIAVVDYGMGNIGSILNILKKIGADSFVLDDPGKAENIDISGLILPGVGSFDNAIIKLRERGFDLFLKDYCKIKKKPLLGVCLGMQLLFDSSEEGVESGLSFVPGVVKRFNFENLLYNKLKVPHMGWNNLVVTKNDPLFDDMIDKSRFYFVHSYHVVCSDTSDELSTTLYGNKFTSSISHENIRAVQFHPEKSHKFGLKLIENFVKKICNV